MPVTPNFLIDEDVTGEGSMEGLTFSFQNEDQLGVELLHDYVEDVFEASSDKVSNWTTMAPTFCTITLNGAEKRLFDSMRRIIQPVLSTAAKLTDKCFQEMKIPDLALIYFNANWYMIMFNYINSRIQDTTKKATPNEIFELHRVWILQCVYRVTATDLFNNKADFYASVRRIKITKDRYFYLFGKLGSNVAESIVDNNGDDDQVWGSFNHHNDIISKLESHVGEVGKQFLVEKFQDLTIDDDKMRHTSKTFGDLGLQRTGHRGCRYGPVMNAAGSVQSGLILSIHFSRKGDGPLSIVKSLVTDLDDDAFQYLAIAYNDSHEGIDFI
jgi:hypothetical protein